MLINLQLGYGTGTARATNRKGGKNLDMDLVKTIVMAIKAGFYHLDGAEGNLAFLHIREQILTTKPVSLRKRS